MLSYKQIVRRFSCDKKSGKVGTNYVKPLRGLRKYITNKIIKFFERYETIIEKRFPSTSRIFKLFSFGTKELYKDVLEYFRISRELSYGKRVRDFNYNELMIYFQTPKDLQKVGPVLLLSALPGTFVFLPLVYWMPKYLLSSHFWTLEQRTQFQVSDSRNQLYYYRPVFRHLQSKLEIVTNEDNLQDKCRHIFAKLGSGTHPTVEEVLEVKRVFIEKPYGLQYLTSRHLTSLCRMHGLNWFIIGKRARLWNHMGFVREMDLAINRDGIHSLNVHQIRRACFLRGLNPMFLSKEDMIIWLQMWLNIAQNVDRHSLSLLLHSPLFVAYNNASNWRLIH